MKYYLQVDVQDGPGAEGNYHNAYRGDSVPDAMAAWSEAIGNGVEYVMLEALKQRPKGEGT